MPRPLPPSPAVVGIVNATPDSFSDGGECLDPALAAERAARLVEEGAGALDVGAESTRPGAVTVDPATERERLLPVLRAIRASVDVPLSVDTRNASTARAALDEGADVLNDVSMLRHDPAIAEVAARAGATLVLMHSRGTPKTMAEAPRYDDVVREVREELEEACRAAREAGCARLVIDPGFGFAKDATHNLALLRGLAGVRLPGLPLLVGLSRKSLVGHLLGENGSPRPVAFRAAGSVGLALAARLSGADYLRVHDVALTVDALRTFEAARGGTRER